MVLIWSNSRLINTTKPLLSIIIPIYNRIQYFQNMLKSILFQNHKINGIIELVIVDDNSKENISNLILTFLKKISSTYNQNSKIVNEFQFIYYKNSQNKGEFPNTNYGLKMSNGIWKYILHDDDYILQNLFKTISFYLKRNKTDIGFICFNYHNIHNNKIIYHGPNLSVYSKINTNKKFQTLFLYNDPLHLHCLVYHEDVFKELGYFSEKFKYYNVWEFHIRSNKSKLKWIYINKELVAYREHEDINRQTNLRDKDIDNNLKKFYSTAIINLTNEQKKIFDIGILKRNKKK